MAGIGFELKKLFLRDGLYSKAKAVGYSVMVILGPSIMSIFLLTIFNELLKSSGVSLIDRELFQATIMYSFVFGVIITSGFSLVLTRYVSDKIYRKLNCDIKASLYGALTIITVISFIISVLFYYNSELNIYYKIFASFNFVEICIMQILTVYVTSLKKYNTIHKGFIFGMLSAVFLEAFLLKILISEKLLCSIISFTFGMMIIILVLLYGINKYFTGQSDRYFEFIKYFKKYYQLFFINTFYFLGLYINNFIYWNVKDIRIIIGGTFVYAPQYDVPAFFAFLTTVSINVIFIIKFETSFSIKWSEYLLNINSNASLIDIENSKKHMVFTLKSELGYILMVQFVISIIFLVLGYNFLGIFGLDNMMQDIFKILVLSYYCIGVIFVLITILLYFDDRRGAFFISSVFFITNLILTLITVYFGQNYFGFGTFISSLFSMLVGLYRVQYFINNIDYYIFCKNSAWN